MAKSPGIFEGRGIGVYSGIETPALITFTEDGSTKPINVIVTDFRGQVSENYQVMKSFTDDVFITLFGQALTMYNLNCVTLPREDVCDTAKTTMDTLIDIYNKYRIGNDNRPVLTITIDKLTIEGFLVAMPIATKNARGLNAIEFSLKILGQAVLQ